MTQQENIKIIKKSKISLTSCVFFVSKKRQGLIVGELVNQSINDSVAFGLTPVV
jgi:hypothetical protein